MKLRPAIPRTILAVALTAGTWVGTASAQALPPDVPGRVAYLWDAYLADCGRAVADPNGFLQSHPPHNPAAGVVVDSTPDGQVVVARIFQGVAYSRQIEFLGTPGRLVIICEASIGAYDALSGAMPGHDAAGGVAAVPFADLLRAHAAAQPGVTIAGGPVEGHDVLEAVSGLSVERVAGSQQHIFSISAPMGGEAAFIYGYADGYSIHLTGAHFIEAGAR